MRKSYILYYIVISTLILACTNNDKKNTAITTDILPVPHSVNLTPENISLPKKLMFSKEIEKHAQLGTFIQNNLNRMFSNQAHSNQAENISLSFTENDALAMEAYVLEIKKDSIIIQASDEFGYVRAAATLLQLPDENGELPIGVIEDEPDFNYRALMIDCSRSWYSPSTIKQIIDLCFWYKIKYLHLHLTDDNLFTFSSNAFPKLASAQSYSLADLKELNEYAYQRGCILIPEIDMPGHASNFVSQYPEVFSIKDKSQNYWTINMGKKEAYDGINILLKEVAEAFPYSPYIHIGGDEFNGIGLADDPDTIAYMKSNNIATLDELYHHFIIKVSQMVKDLDKTPIVWSDFTNNEEIKVPNDILVMYWKPIAYHPDELMKDGFQIINASWQPLYVVNNRKWSAEEIFNWDVTTWKSSQTPSSKKGISIDPHQNLIGGSMSVWEQNEYKAITSLRQRLSAMSQRLWNNDYKNYDDYFLKSSNTDMRLNKFLYNFELKEKGLLYPDWKDANFSEDMWFNDSLIISAIPLKDDIVVGYHFFSKENVKREIPPRDSITFFDSLLVIDSNASVMFQAYQKSNGEAKRPIGHPIYKNYSLSPVKIETEGLIKNYQPHNWLNHRFTDSIKVTLSSARKGNIYYTLNNETPTIASKKYTNPFYIKNSSHLKAGLISSETDESIGNIFFQEYVKVGLEKSKTTGKPITTSNGANDLSVISFINDGEIARWDHWGDHTDDENWIIVDLEKEEKISQFKTYTFWDNNRYYEYTIEVSNDHNNWRLVVDRSNNRELSTPEGITDDIEPISARYIKLNLIRNSANPGLHLVEFNAF